MAYRLLHLPLLFMWTPDIPVRGEGALANFFFFTFTQNFLMNNQQEPNQLNIEISEETAEGTYANLAVITHSMAEFVIDFVNVMPGTPKSKVKSRIIFTPQHAKRFMKALIDNVQKFEAANGMIKDLDEVQIPVNFGGPTAQA
ncbi:MAG: DUF3467 domain-containing protein [Niabella sp.]